MNSSISENLADIQARIVAAAERAGRKADAITLVAVSKAHSPETLMEGIDAGALILGENRVQEAKAKKGLLSSKVQWHLIGHLQSNKVRQALTIFDRIHSIDSLELAQEVNRIAGELGLFPKVMLEVNVAGEASKFGFKPEALIREIEEIAALDRLAIDGLMAIPPFCPKAEDSRKYFIALRECRDRLQTECRFPLPELSMGMSHDFEVAIEEGATFVRVGTAIFGERKGKAWKPVAADD